MPQTIKKSAASMVKEAMAEVKAISVEEALSLVDSPSHVFVDLRDSNEQERGRIHGAIPSSRGLNGVSY